MTEYFSLIRSIFSWLKTEIRLMKYDEFSQHQAGCQHVYIFHCVCVVHVTKKWWLVPWWSRWDPSRPKPGIIPSHGRTIRVSEIWSFTQHISGWWFQTFVIFPYLGNNHPNWLFFQRGWNHQPDIVYTVTYISKVFPMYSHCSMTILHM